MSDDKTPSAALDITTDFYIRRMYRDEYTDRVHPELKGVAGWVVRKREALFDKIGKLTEKNEFLGLAAWMAAGVAPAYIIVGALLVNPPVGLALLVGAVGTAMYTNARQAKAAEAALTRDIGNGTLLERYKAEILAPQLQEVDQKLGSLPAPGNAAAQFTAAADSAQPDAKPPSKGQLSITLPPLGM